MLDLFAIFTKGGILLWAYSPHKQDYCALLDRFIQTVLIEATLTGSSLVSGALELRWTLQNDLSLIFVAAYQKILPLTYVPSLLEQVKSTFIKIYGRDLRERPFSPISGFEKIFMAILNRAENATDNTGRKSPAERTSEPELSAEKEEPSQGDDRPAIFEANHSSETMAEKLARMRAGKQRGGKSASASKPEQSQKAKDADAAPVKKGKQMRTWSDKATKADMASLDFSSKAEEKSGDSSLAKTPSKSLTKSLPNGQAMAGELEDIATAEDVDDYLDSLENSDVNGQQAKSGRLWGVFQSLTGQTELTREGLLATQQQMREHLINKNVAADVADVICASVVETLVGQKLGTFQSATSVVRKATEAAVQKILTPRSAVDLLYEAKQTCQSGRPYVITFVGVNGVGKSTNLSKVCFWLLQNGLRVLIAACDTFRSGAVEQLGVHVKNLRRLRDDTAVELYQRGYEKDSAHIAKEAIAYARTNEFDVVMIDTAGRMQDNVPLMRSLAKLIHLNKPDKVIFVGEALVGNEAVDQLKKFNAALKDCSPTADRPHYIDGILLTKFDTIDDKVGAALSMTFVSGAPILFVGTGQTYTDLKKMNVKAVVDTLLKA